MIIRSSRVRFQIYPVAICVLLFFSLVISLGMPASWDVAWRLEIADRILKGALLYRDVIEVNPPLWFWSALPSTMVAKALGVAPYIMLCICIHVAALTAVWLLDRCLALSVHLRQRNWMVIGALIAILLLPVGDVGQREIPILIGGLLWGALAVARVKAAPLPLWLVISITLFAAYGFALKHYYLVIPIGIEIWVALKLKRAWRPLRIENLMLAGMALVYAVAVIQLAPNFLTDIVPLVALSYADVKAASLATPWLHGLYIALQICLIIMPLYLARLYFKSDDVAQVLLITLSLHIVAIILQGKGFANHFLAAKGAAIILWAYICSDPLNNQMKLTVNPRTILGVLTFGWIAMPVALLVAPLLSPSLSVSSAHSGPAASASDAVVTAITAEPKQSRIYTVSTNPGLSFYVVWSQGRPHFSRNYSMWMLPGLLTSQMTASTRQAATDQLNAVLTMTIAEIQCAAPHLLIGDTTQMGRSAPSGFQTYEINPLGMLVTQSAFADWLTTNYTAVVTSHAGVTMWRAKAQSGPVPKGCDPPIHTDYIIAL